MYQALAGVLAILAILGGAVGFGYSSGKVKVQRAWDTAIEAQVKSDQREALRKMEANHGNGLNYAKLAQTAAVNLSRANSELERLRNVLASPAPAQSDADSWSDGPSPTAVLLSECSGRYAEVAGAADRLSAQVSGLQGYARDVCLGDEVRSTVPSSTAPSSASPP